MAPVVKNLPSNEEDMSLIPGQGTKIPHAAEQLSLWAPTRKPVCLKRDPVWCTEELVCHNHDLIQPNSIFLNICSHVIVWQKPLQYYKVISLQLIKINEKNIYVHIYFIVHICEDQDIVCIHLKWSFCVFVFLCFFPMTFLFCSPSSIVFWKGIFKAI